jgi:hypothetical protein
MSHRYRLTLLRVSIKDFGGEIALLLKIYALHRFHLAAHMNSASCFDDTRKSSYHRDGNHT